MTLIKRNSPQARCAASFGAMKDCVEIRSGNDGPGNDSATAPDRALDDGAERIAGLLRRVGELEEALACSEKEKEAACLEATEQAYAKGLASAEAREAERITVLEAAIQNALSIFERKVDEEHDLALDIAGKALDRVFADTSLYRQMVIETATRNMALLRRDTILKLRVSSIDFPEDTALDALAPLDARLLIECDQELASGGCVFELSMGMLDVSIPRQISVLEKVFEQSRGISAATRTATA